MRDFCVLAIVIALKVTIAIAGLPKYRHSMSCAQIYKPGIKNGYYQLHSHQLEWTALWVYCDFESERGYAYTLVMSYSAEERDAIGGRIFDEVPLYTDSPVNEEAPNNKSYRLSLGSMKKVLSCSHLWRMTCEDPATIGTKQILKDYVRVKKSVLDPLEKNVAMRCTEVEYINLQYLADTYVSCAHCQVEFQQLDGEILYVYYKGSCPNTFTEPLVIGNYFNVHLNSVGSHVCSFGISQLWFGSKIM